MRTTFEVTEFLGGRGNVIRRVAPPIWGSKYIWRNRYTRMIEVHVAARPCRFDSCYVHCLNMNQGESQRIIGVMGLLWVLVILLLLFALFGGIAVSHWLFLLLIVVLVVALLGAA